MSKGKILLVEPDEDIRKLLESYFTERFYWVATCDTVHAALHSIHQLLPSVILTEIDLPDKSGWDLVRELRQTTRTSHIPIIYITHRDSRSDKIMGLELGADDYMTKPIDVDELGKRIEYIVETMYRTGPYITTKLPSGHLIEKHLREIMQQDKEWIYIDIKIMLSETYKEVYGWNEWDRFLIKFADLLREVWQNDFVGHPGGDNFVVITEREDYETYLEALLEKFSQTVKVFYSETDGKQGFILVNGEQKPLMSISYGVCDASKRDIKDIREITELAAEDRRRRDPNYVANQGGDSDIVTQW